MFSWLSSVMADTKRTTKNRGLSCQQRNAQHHSNTRRKIPARVRFSAERVFRETKKTRGRNLDRRSPSQKRNSKMQGNQSTTPEGTERRFREKSRGLKFGLKLSPNQRVKLGRRIGANCRHELRNCIPLERKFSPAADSRRHSASRPEK